MTCSPGCRVTSRTGMVVPLISACMDTSLLAQGSMSDSRQLWSAPAGIVEDVTQTSTTQAGGGPALKRWGASPRADTRGGLGGSSPRADTDDERRYQAAVSKDPRFDGVFFIAVTSTGIYCRPSCPAITPKRENMRFCRSAAAAQEAGFRACKRCRPDASPGSPEWNIRADVVGRAMRLIADGVVDRGGAEGLARRLGYEQRQVRRLVTAELGAGPLAIARAQRAQTARVLTETTALPLSEIAFAAGFTSIRQFNSTIREVFAVTPTHLRQARGQRAPQTRRLLPASGQAAAPR